MNAHSITLIIILGFIRESYMSVESMCPTSGFYTRTYSLVSNCDTSSTISSSSTTVTWNDGTQSTFNNTVTFNYDNGELSGIGTAVVQTGRFTGFNVTTVFAHSTKDSDEKCANRGISELAGVAQISFLGSGGVFACIGRANIAFNPPLTNTARLVQRTNTVNYGNCIAVGLRQC